MLPGFLRCGFGLQRVWSGEPPDVEELVRPVHLVPETMPVIGPRPTARCRIDLARPTISPLTFISISTDMRPIPCARRVRNDSQKYIPPRDRRSPGTPVRGLFGRRI